MTRLQLSIKRGFDVVGSGFAIIALAPLLIICSVLVHAGSPGPTLIRQERTGQLGKSFTIYKFRTIYNRPLANAVYPGPGDLTWFGRWSRRFGIDELPQLFNILRGQMSFIGGYRPVLVREHAIRFGPESDFVTTMRPGLLSSFATGEHRKSHIGRTFTNIPVTTYNREAVRMAMEYMHGWTLGRDAAVAYRSTTAAIGMVWHKFIRSQ